MRARICELNIREKNQTTTRSATNNPIGLVNGEDNSGHEAKEHKSKLKRMRTSLHSLEHNIIEMEHKAVKRASVKLMDVSAGGRGVI